jgi:hypothetical protein
LGLMAKYVEGVSTRKVKEVTEELCGTSFSKSLVSQLAGSPTPNSERGGSTGLKRRLTPTCLWTLATKRLGWTAECSARVS